MFFVLLVILYSGSGSVKYDMNPGEEMEISVYTRSMTGAKFTVVDANNKAATPWISDIDVKHTGPDDAEAIPSHVIVTKTNIKGPAAIKVKAESIGSRWTTQNFLVVFSVLNP
jgi:hypothetical protein